MGLFGLLDAVPHGWTSLNGTSTPGVLIREIRGIFLELLRKGDIWSTLRPRSAIISSTSRELSEYRTYKPDAQDDDFVHEVSATKQLWPSPLHVFYGVSSSVNL